jgi:hypothetical protein
VVQWSMSARSVPARGGAVLGAAAAGRVWRALL